MSSVDKANPAQKLMGQRAKTLEKYKELSEKQNGVKIDAGPNGSLKSSTSGLVKPLQKSETPSPVKDKAQVSETAKTASVDFKAKTGSLAEQVFEGTINQPFEAGIISQDTRDDLLKMVNDGTLSREAATYLAKNVDSLGGDVMVKIALDLCKQDPSKFKAAFQSGDLYQNLVEEHHNRYYPDQSE